MVMLSDALGKLGNTSLPVSSGLLPLFEAISNSIHAIAEKKEPNGEIRIEVIRNTEQKSISLDDEKPAVLGPIVAFVVTDNGAGFTTENFTSFQTADSRRKLAKGGKGLGRFSWLKAFEYASIESVYLEKKKKHKRTFLFRPTEKGVEDDKVVSANGDPQLTTVTLHDFSPKYSKHAPKSTDTLARRIVEHFLPQFIVQETAPHIVVHDAQEDTLLDLRTVFKSQMLIEKKDQTFKVDEQSFKITHLRLLTPQEKGHSLCLCATQRTVTIESLSKLLPNLEGALEDAQKRKFFYFACVSGAYLDDNVEPERLGFKVGEKRQESGQSSLFEDEGPHLDEIKAESLKRARKYLEEYTKPLSAAKAARVVQFMEKAPQYRPLLVRVPDKIDALKPTLNDEQLDIELYKMVQQWDIEVMEEYTKLLKEKQNVAISHNAFKEHYERFLKEWNDLGVSKLARYVVHRRATLEFLTERLKLRPQDDKYALEEAIHEIIFPLKKNSDDVRAENMNLWILDERLAYHYWLASDIPMHNIEPIKVEGEDRPDLLIFNSAFAFSETENAPYSAIVIVEFKRPMRNDYTEAEKDNPIVQVYEYIEQLRNGKSLTKDGRPMNVADLPMYAYIVCDLTPTFRKQATHYGLHRTPDNEGFFGYHRDFRAYIEVMSFDKLVADARKRNQVMFDKLGLDGKAGSM